MRTKRLLFSGLTAAIVIALASQHGDAAPGVPTGRLILTSFVQRGRSDIRRNEVLEFRFSQALRRKSVDLRTLQVNELIPEGRKPVVGARVVQGNVVRLDPRRSQRNYDASIGPNAPAVEIDHQVGFSASADFEVFIPAGPVRRVVRARDGTRISRRFHSVFHTGTLYDDPVPGQPQTAPWALSFDPPRSGVTGLVDPDASIRIAFSEPILPESMRLGDTVFVKRVADGSVLDGTLVPDSPNLNVYVFTPTGGFGPDVLVQVEITTGVTDLGGNALRQPVTKGAL